MALFFKVQGQKLSPASDLFLAASTLNYPDLTFNFDDEWTGFSKVATFSTSNSELYKVAVKDDKCTMPAEVMLGNERVSVSVYGTKGNIRITTNIVSIPCHCSGYGAEIEPSEQTVDLLAQLHQEITEIKQNYLSKEQFRVQLQAFTAQVFNATCKLNYNSTYLKPLNGFRINKSDYQPSKGDVVVIWANNEVLTPGADYILNETDGYWEITNSSLTAGMYLTVQVWNTSSAENTKQNIALKENVSVSMNSTNTYSTILYNDWIDVSPNQKIKIVHTYDGVTDDSVSAYTNRNDNGESVGWQGKISVGALGTIENPVTSIKPFFAVKGVADLAKLTEFYITIEVE